MGRRSCLGFDGLEKWGRIAGAGVMSLKVLDKEAG